MDNACAALLQRGEAAWSQLKTTQTWQQWVTVGRALSSARDEIVQRLGGCERGPQYNAAFDELVAEHPWIAEIGKTQPSRLYRCIAKLDNIEWRSTLTDSERAEWDSPKAVLQHWARAH